MCPQPRTIGRHGGRESRTACRECSVFARADHGDDCLCGIGRTCKPIRPRSAASDRVRGRSRIPDAITIGRSPRIFFRSADIGGNPSTARWIDSRATIPERERFHGSVGVAISRTHSSGRLNRKPCRRHHFFFGDGFARDIGHRGHKPLDDVVCAHSERADQRNGREQNEKDVPRLRCLFFWAHGFHHSLTCTGKVLSALFPSPSHPFVPSPQHQSVPLLRVPQVVLNPA